MSATFDLDHAYLRATVGAPLTEAMAQIAVLQPEDPVEFLGNYLLKYVENEIARQQRDKQQQSSPSEQSSSKDVTSVSGSIENQPDEMELSLGQERVMQTELRNETTVPQLFQRFLEWLCSALHAEEAYIGRKTVDAGGNNIVHFVASWKPNNSGAPDAPSVTINKFITEENGITFDALTEVEDPSAPVDAEGNTLPPAVPKFVHVPNVLREQRMKFFHVPKMGAYLTRGLKYKSFLHADVFNDTNPEEPNIKEEWLVVSLDTMGQARAFTQQEIEKFQRSTALFIQTLEELERDLYMRDFEQKSTNDDALLREFHVAFNAEMAVQEENLTLQLQSLPDEEKKPKESEARLQFMTQLLINHTPTLAMASTRAVPFKPVVLTTFAAALTLLGHSRQALYNPVTKTPSWPLLAPLLEEAPLKACLESFPIAAPPSCVAEVKDQVSVIAKAEIDAASPIALCFFLWTEAVITYSEQLEIAAEAERQKMLEAAEQRGEEE